MDTSFTPTDTHRLLQQLVPSMEVHGNLPNTLTHLAEVAQREFAADICVVGALHPFTGVFTHTELIAHMSSTGEVVAGTQLQAEEVFPEPIEHDTFLISDLDALPEYRTPFTQAEQLRAFATLVLKTHQGHQPLGVLYLGFRQHRTFGVRDCELIQIFLHQAASLLQETWLLHRYSEVVRIGQEINQDLTTVEVLFNKLYRSIAPILDIRHALLLAVYQQQTDDFDMYVKDDGRDFCFNRRHLKGASRYVLTTQKSTIIEHWSEEHEHLPFQLVPIPGTTSKESYVFVPLILRGLALGILSVQNHSVHAYTQDDVAILNILANHVVSALNTMRLYHHLSQLHETAQLLTQHIDAEHTLQAMVDKIQEATYADCVALYPGQSHPHRVLNTPVISGILPRTSSDQLFMQWLDEIAPLVLHQDTPIFAQDLVTIEKMVSMPHPELSPEDEKDISSLAALPLSVDTTAVGVLYLLFRQSQHFDAPQRRLIDGLGHYAAIAISNAQAFSAIVQRRTSELLALQEVDHALNRSSLELGPMLHMLLHAACKFVPAQSAAVLLHFPKKHLLEVKAVTGRKENVRRTLALSQQEEKGLIWWTMQQKELLCLGDVHVYPWSELYIQVDPETMSELDVPLLDEGEVIGVLNFESTAKNAFSEQDQDFLRILAGQAVLAIKKAQAYEREKRLAEEQKVLNEISKEIISQLDPNRVFNLILDKALNVTESSTGVLMLHDPESHRLWMAAEHGVIPEKRWQSHSVDDGVVGHVFRTKQKLNVDPSQEQWRRIYLNYIPDTRSELAVPILVGETVYGVLNIESTEPHKFDIHDESLLEGLADLAVIAMQNAKLYERVEKEAQHFDLMYQVSRRLGELTEIEQLDQAYNIIFHHAEMHRQCRVVLRGYSPLDQCLVLLRASVHSVPLLEKMGVHEGINGLVTRERRTIVLDDATQQPPGIPALKLTDPTIRSIVVAPIQTKDRYYGTLGLNHREDQYFQKTDVQFVEGLAQQLASTIYRLETIQAQKESEQQKNAALEVSIIGQSAMELTHRLGNELGLVETYVNGIRRELKALSIENEAVEKRLESIASAARTVLNLSIGLKESLARSNEAIQDERVGISPRCLFDHLRAFLSLPSSIQLKIVIDDTVADVYVFEKLVDDILLNLAHNAIDAMPGRGELTLSAYNAGNQVALAVQDTGIGIPAHKRENIFSLFFSTKGSSGFGLWSARRNALRNQGDLKVESQPGHGSTFILLLPREYEEEKLLARNDEKEKGIV